VPSTRSPRTHGHRRLPAHGRSRGTSRVHLCNRGERSSSQSPAHRHTQSHDNRHRLAHTITYGDADGYCHRVPDAVSHGIANGDVNGDVNSVCDPHANGDTQSRGHLHTRADPGAYA